MTAEVLGNQNGRLEQRLVKQLKEAGLNEITWISPDILEVHDGWREDGSAVWRMEYEIHGQILPIACIHTYFYSFKQVMEKYGPKDITWKVWMSSPAVCSKVIAVAIKGNIINEVIMEGSCMGFSNALNILVKGMEISRVVQLLQNVPCQTRGTSCPQELSKGLRNG